MAVDPQHRYSNETERVHQDIYDAFKLKKAIRYPGFKKKYFSIGSLRVKGGYSSPGTVIDSPFSQRQYKSILPYNYNTGRTFYQYNLPHSSEHGYKTDILFLLPACRMLHGAIEDTMARGGACHMTDLRRPRLAGRPC